MNGGGGSADVAAGANSAELLRGEPGLGARWPRRQTVTLLLAFVPFAVAALIGFVLS